MPQLAYDDEDITQFCVSVLLIDDDYIMHRITTVMLNDLEWPDRRVELLEQKGLTAEQVSFAITESRPMPFEQLVEWLEQQNHPWKNRFSGLKSRSS